MGLPVYPWLGETQGWPWHPSYPWLHDYWTRPHIQAYHLLAESAWENQQRLEAENGRLREALEEVALRLRVVEKYAEGI